MTRDYSKAAPTDHQRRQKFKRGDEWIRALLHRGRIARIAHVSGDQPFISPTNYWFDDENHQLIFHSAQVGRRRANLEKNPKVCVEVSDIGRNLPSNDAIEFSIQYRSVMVFGTVHFLEDKEEKRRGLNGLLKRYHPEMESGKDYKPITDESLRITNVYVVRIDSWSGKEHWAEQAEQVEDWPPLPEKYLKPIS